MSIPIFDVLEGATALLLGDASLYLKRLLCKKALEKDIKNRQGFPRHPRKPRMSDDRQ